MHGFGLEFLSYFRIVLVEKPKRIFITSLSEQNHNIKYAYSSAIKIAIRGILRRCSLPDKRKNKSIVI